MGPAFGPRRGVPFAPRGPKGPFPRFDANLRRSDSPPSVSPHFVSFAWRYHRCVRDSSPTTPNARPRIILELVSRCSVRHLRWRRRGLPSSRGTLVIIRPVLRPRRDRADSLGPSVVCPTRPPHLTTTRAHREKIGFRGSIARLLIWLSTLRSEGRPSPRKTRFRPLARLYRTGLDTRRVPAKGFKRCFPPLPSFLAQCQFYLIENRAIK